MPETWNADKKFHTAMAVVIAIVKGCRGVPGIHFRWQDVADMLNHGENYGLTDDAVRDQFLGVLRPEFLAKFGPEEARVPPPGHSGLANLDYPARPVAFGHVADPASIGIANGRPNPSPQQDQHRPQATAPAVAGAGEERVKRPIRIKVIWKRKAADGSCGPDAPVKKARRDFDDDDDDDHDVAASGSGNSPSDPICLD